MLFFCKKPIYLNIYFFIFRNLKDIKNPPKTAQMLSKNINKQSKITFVKKKNYYTVTKCNVIVWGPWRPQR
jgi:hypothetical protein